MKVVVISGAIGSDVLPADVRRALALANGSEPVEIQISSPGGYVVDGLEIFSMIRGYSGPTTTRIIGVAASMASYIACAADRVIAEANAAFMLHNVLGGAIGNHHDLRKSADVFEGFSGLLAAEYARRSGMSLADIEALMNLETWYFGPEIVEAGFADAIEGTPSNARPHLEAQARARVADCIARVRGSTADRDRPEQLAAAVAAARASAGTQGPRPLPPNGLSVLDYAKLRAAGMTDDEISLYSKKERAL